jgi:hypothetical protein
MIAARIFAAVAFAVALAATPACANTVTLECVGLDQNGQPKPIPDWHALVEINYDAQTVRTYVLHDDGVVDRQAAVLTYPAQILQDEITWSTSDGKARMTLSRTTGDETAVNALYGTFKSHCDPWAGSMQPKRF